MKQSMNIIALGLLLSVVSCTTESPTTSEVIQHNNVEKVSLDGPMQEVAINTKPIEVEQNVEKKEQALSIEQPIITKKVNQGPQKS